MDVRVTFPGGLRVTAEVEGFAIATDQPTEAGGEGTAPAPFDLFVASIGTCVGYYVVRFLRERNLSTDGLELKLATVAAPEDHRIAEIVMTLVLPEGFPQRYRAAIVRAAEQCSVKRHLVRPPSFTMVLETRSPEAEVPASA